MTHTDVGKTILCRATAEQAARSDSASLPAARQPLRRTSSEKPPPGIATPTAAPALPPRHPRAAPQHETSTQPQSAPVSAVQPALPRSAKRSLLSRHAPQASLQQQPEVVVPPSGSAVTRQMPDQRLDAIPEGTEEPLVQPVPQVVQQNSPAAQPVTAAGRHSRGQGLAAPGGAVPARPEAEQAAAARQQHTSSADSHRASLLAAPGAPASFSNFRRLEAVPSSPDHQHAGPALSHPAAALAAASEGASESGAPMSLLQLAQAPSAQQQQVSSLSALPQPPTQTRYNQTPANQQTKQVGMGFGASERQHTAERGADPLQGLQASLIQTLTSTVESAMTQMR